MNADSRLIDRLAEAVLDGDSVDWVAAESGAGEAAANRRIQHLKTIARVAQVHRLEQWAHLRILERIGRGAFGEVYRAWDTRLDREVALKLLPADPQPAAGPASSIIQEGRLLARVRHPNVATIHGADEIDGYIGLWMEFVRGQTLEGLLRAGATFTPTAVADIGLQLGRALAAVHSAGLLHRDIKAQNVMRADEGRIVLMDFGTGREIDDPRSDLTGTPLYLAPEVFHGQPATAQSDIYSLGVLLYNLLTRLYPVHGSTLDEVREAHGSPARADTRAVRADVPSRLARIIERAIAPEPETRYATAEAFCADLEQLARASARSRWIRRGAAAAVVLLSALLVAQQRGWLKAVPGANQVASSFSSAIGFPSRSMLSAVEQPVLAVHFVYLGNEPEGDLIVDGLTYQLVGRLAALDGLEVRPAPSSLTLKGRGVDVQTFGRELGANLVLAGSVLGLPGTMRINAQLVRVADNATVWAGSFESIGHNVLSVEKNLFSTIVDELNLRGAGQRAYQLDPALQDLFLKARALQARRGKDNVAEAVALFEQIIEVDENFAPAYAGLASALGELTSATGDVEMAPPDPRMGRAALKAIHLDSELAEAHAAMGSHFAHGRDLINARVSYTKAIELNPILTTAYCDFVLRVLIPLWKISEALQVMERARHLDPTSLDVARVLALVQVEAGLYDQAIQTSRWVLDRDSEFPFVTKWLVRALILSGRGHEAEPLIGKLWEYQGFHYARIGRRAEAEAIAAAHPGMPARQMIVYAGLGDRDRAYAALERTADLHWWRAAWYMLQPEVALLHNDPRVAALRKRLWLTE